MLTDANMKGLAALRQAALHHTMALVECTDKNTGAAVIVVCFVRLEGDEQVFIPLAKLFNGDPSDEIDPPTKTSQLH